MESIDATVAIRDIRLGAKIVILKQLKVVHAHQHHLTHKHSHVVNASVVACLKGHPFSLHLLLAFALSIIDIPFQHYKVVHYNIVCA